MDHLEQLLKQVSKIVKKEKRLQEKRRKRGENFNIFGVLGLSRSEVRLHSAFLAELLNPNGDHGLGAKFLIAFVEDIISKNSDFSFDVNSAQVKVEYNIGTVTSNYEEGGRMDILIFDAKQHAIIIENKVDAGDQEKQMLRYYNWAEKWAKQVHGEYVLIYLTLDGHMPSDYSTDKNLNIKIICVSYEKHIKNWLEKCIQFARLYPSIREILSQYIINLKQILNIMSDENGKELINYLTKNENIDSVLDILDFKTEICKKVWRIYIEKTLCVIANRFDLEITGTADFVDGGGKLSFTPKDDKGNQKSTRFILENTNGNISYYFFCQDKKEHNALKEGVASRIQEGYPYGWKYIGEKGTNRNGWENWYNISTIKQLVEECRKEYDELKNEDNTIAKEIIDQLKNFGLNEMTS